MNNLNKIKKSFILKENYNSEFIAFSFHPNLLENGHIDLSYSIISISSFEPEYGKSFLDALSSMSDNYRKLKSDKDKADAIIDWFECYIDKFRDYYLEGMETAKKLYEKENFEEFSFSIFKFLSDKGILLPLKKEIYEPAIIWPGMNGFKFMGRTPYEVLRSYAINNRKHSPNIDGHRKGLEYFMIKFKEDMNRYFGTDNFNDEGFLRSLLSTGIFRKIERRV